MADEGAEPSAGPRASPQMIWVMRSRISRGRTLVVKVTHRKLIHGNGPRTCRKAWGEQGG